MKARSFDNTKNTGDIYMEELKQSQLEAITILIKKLSHEEMSACLEAALILSRQGSIEISKEKLIRTLKTDFGISRKMKSGSPEHYSLLEKLNLLTEPENELFVLLCHQFWHGEINIIRSIVKLVNEHCQTIDKLRHQVLNICPVEEFNSDDDTVTQVNYVIDTNLPINIYFSLMSDEAA